MKVLIVAPGPLEILILLFVIIIVIPFWKIFTKAGYPGVLSLVMFVPLVNIILIYYFAFAKWPAIKETKDEASK